MTLILSVHPEMSLSQDPYLTLFRSLRNSIVASSGEALALAGFDPDGPLDVIVHGASPMVRPTNVEELGYALIELYLKTYLGGALALVSDASPGMRERRFGRFIFLGTSYMFGIPPEGVGAYLPAKYALYGLVRCMATELGPAGITTNMVSPSITVTDFTADIPARVKEVEARKSPMRRLATVRDTAELAGFLASDAAGYMNGENLPVTGGPI